MGVPDIPKHHNRVVVEPGSVGAGKSVGLDGIKTQAQLQAPALEYHDVLARERDGQRLRWQLLYDHFMSRMYFNDYMHHNTSREGEDLTA